MKKNRVYKTAITLSLLFLLLSCISKKKEYTEYTFSQTKELKGETIELDTAIFRFPFRIRQAEDKVIVMDLHGT